MALILNHLQQAKTTEKGWSLATNSKFNAICCFNAAVLHPNNSFLGSVTNSSASPKLASPSIALVGRIPEKNNHCLLSSYLALPPGGVNTSVQDLRSFMTFNQ